MCKKLSLYNDSRFAICTLFLRSQGWSYYGNFTIQVNCITDLATTVNPVFTQADEEEKKFSYTNHECLSQLNINQLHY